MAAGKEKKRRDCAFRRQVNEPSIILGCPGAADTKHASSFTFETQTGKHPGKRQQKGAPTDKSLLIGSS